MNVGEQQVGTEAPLSAKDMEMGEFVSVLLADDQIQMQQQGYVVPDSFTHGTSQQRKSWLAKGIQTGDYRQGDTFSRTVVL